MPGPSEQPDVLVREALVSPYGRALVAELGNAMRAAADPACLQSKNLSPQQLTERGGQLMTTWGIRVMEKVLTYIDPKVYEEKFAASAGRNASAELARLRENADVKRYLALERPLRFAKVLDFIFEQFDRYALLSRLKIASISPIATGNMTLMEANPSEKSEEALEQFRQAKQSAPVQRFLVLGEQAATAMAAAMKQDQIIRVGPSTFYRGVENDLAELCVGKR